MDPTDRPDRTPRGHRPIAALGLIVWAIAGVDLLALARADGDSPTDPMVVAITALYLGFGASFALAMRYGARWSRAAVLALLLVQAAFSLLYLDLSFLVLLLAPLLLPRRQAVAFGFALIGLAGFLSVDALLDTPGMLPPHRKAVSVGFAVGLDVLRVASIQAFALACGLVAAIERGSREELELVHAELAAAQVALAAQERASERARIQRELHDGLGHHLAALGLTLELLRHRRDDPAPVEDARSLVTRLLGDVRAIVRHDASAEPLAIRDALAALVSAFPTVRTRLAIDDDAARPRPDVAHAILRVAQEATTNAIRHGRARTIAITVQRDPSATVLCVTDDGRGFAAAREGTGIPGMHARVEAAGGELTIASGDGRGTMVRARFADP